MDINQRFDQLESLLVDLARKQDQQAEQIKQLIAEVRSHREIFNQQNEAIDQQSEAIDQQSNIISRQSEAISQQSGVINLQSEAISRQGEAIARQGEAIARQGEAIARIEQRLTAIEDQIEVIINIFKISEARHTRSEQQQEAMLLEIKQNGLEIKEQGQRLDAALNVQLEMLQLMRAGNDKSDDLARRIALTEDQEPRIKRLEDEVFRTAS